MALVDHREIVRVLLAAMVSMFLGALDQSIVATALPSIGHDLNALTLLAWVISAYMLSMTAATPVVGKLSDIHRSEERRVGKECSTWRRIAACVRGGIE